MKRPVSRGSVPHGGLCRYIDPDEGFLVTHPYWVWCKAKAKSERLKRGLPIPFEWDAMFEEGFCLGTPKSCVEVPDAPVEAGPSWAALAIQFGAAMFGWVKAGLPIVKWDQFKARHVQCAGDVKTPRCPHFVKFRAFGLTGCGKCGCSSLKLFLATEKCPIGRWPSL